MDTDINQLVSDQFDPILALDPTIADAIPRQVDAQIKLQGYAVSSLTEQQGVYISVLATAAMVPRVLLKFSLKVGEVKGGPAEAKFVEAIKYLEALERSLNEQIKRAAWEADPEDTVGQIPKGPRATLSGLRPL